MRPTWCLAAMMQALLAVLVVPGARADYYLSTTGNDSWSGKLAVPNTSKTDGPFASLERACRAAAASGDKAIAVRKGTYFLSRTLALGPEHSNLKLTNYPGERPLISGGISMGAWRRDGKIWTASVPPQASSPVRLLRVKDHFLPASRFPQANSKQSWLFTKTAGNVVESNRKDLITVAAGVLKPWTDANDIEVVIFPGKGWFNEILSVTSVDPVNNQIYVDPTRNAAEPIVAGNRFYLRNLRFELTEPGTWCYESKSNSIFLLPPAGSNEPGTVVVPRLTTLIKIAGASNITINGFDFRDTSYSERLASQYSPADSAVVLSQAKKCVLSNNRFVTLGGYAMRLEDCSADNLITHNLVEEVGGGGVLLSGNTATHPVRNTISHNLIQRSGIVFKHVSGVSCATAEQTTIFHNKIADMPRYGVSLKSLNQSSMSMNNQIQNNEIYRTNRETADAGAIEILGRARIDTGDVVTSNIIVDTGGLRTDSAGRISYPIQTWGVYLDDYASGVNISGNVFSRCTWAGVFIHGGKNNSITNNLFRDNPQAQVMCQAADDRYFLRSNIFSKNVAVLLTTDAALLTNLGMTQWNPSTFSVWDNNVYWDLGRGFLMNNPKLTPSGGFRKWRAEGFDGHSLIADPLILNNSYLPASPALRLGIDQLNVAEKSAESYGPVPERAHAFRP